MMAHVCMYVSLMQQSKSSRLPPSPPQDVRGFSGAVSPYCQLFESTVCGGFARFVALSSEMCCISRGFVLIQDGGDRSRKDFRVHFGALSQT